ncbi:TMV resistance protein N-like protein [Tanacetum coccineum]
MMIPCTNGRKPLALPWGRTLRLDSGVRSGNLVGQGSAYIRGCRHRSPFAYALRKLTQNLESLDLEECYLVEVNAPLGCLKKLLNLNKCARNPERSLNLKFLELKFNWYLEKLPDDLIQLISLEELILHECLVLQDIPNSICEMKRLGFFYLSNCILVKTLPEEIGRLECLKRLDIEGTSIRHLPQSINWLKGLCISGSRVILESYGLTSEIQTYENETFCYI